MQISHTSLSDSNVKQDVEVPYLTIDKARKAICDTPCRKAKSIKNRGDFIWTKLATLYTLDVTKAWAGGVPLQQLVHETRTGSKWALRTGEYSSKVLVSWKNVHIVFIHKKGDIKDVKAHQLTFSNAQNIYKGNFRQHKRNT